MALEGLLPLLRPIAHKGDARLRVSAEGGRWKDIQARQVLKQAVVVPGVVKGVVKEAPRLRRHLPVRLLVGVQAQRAVAKECITRGRRAGSNLKVAYA